MIIKIYTDGACSGNPGKGGWAAVILEEKKDISGLPLVDWVHFKESSSVFDLIFREGDISSLGNKLLSNTGFRLYSILF